MNKSFLRLFRGEILEGTKRLLILQSAFRMLVLREKDVGLRTLSPWMLAPLAKKKKILKSYWSTLFLFHC